MQLVHYTAEYLYADSYTTFFTSDEEARRWVADARREELRLRSGYYTAPVERLSGEVAGLWADDDESLIGSDAPVPSMPWLDADLDEEIDHLRRWYAGEFEGDPRFLPVADAMATEEWELENLEEDRESWLEDARTLAQDKAMLSWITRDDREIAKEKRDRRKTGADKWLENAGESVVKPRVTGDYWGAGAGAEKAWLDAQLAQLRIEVREILADAKAKGVSRRSALGSAQVQAIVRQAGSLRHRHNFKRYVEALYCNPELAGRDFAERYATVNSKRKAARLSYSDAVKALAGTVTERNQEALMGERVWVGVEGLIAA